MQCSGLSGVYVCVLAMRVESADNVAETQRNISSTLRNLSGLQVSLLVRVGASIIPQTVVSIAAIKASSISCRCNELPVTGEANFSSVTLPSPHLVSVWITIALLLRVVELLQHWGPGCYGAVARSGLWRRCGLARAEYHAISRDARGPDSAAESNGSEARAPSAVDSAESRHRDDPRSPSQRLVSSVQGVWLIVGFLACLALRNDVVEVSPWATSNQVVKNVTAAGFGGGSDPVRLFCGDGAAGCTGSGSAEIVTTRLTSTMLTLFEVLLAMDTIQFGLLPFCLMGVCLVPLMCCCIPMTLISILLCVGLLRSRRRDVPSSASIPNVKTLPFQPVRTNNNKNKYQKFATTGKCWRMTMSSFLFFTHVVMLLFCRD